MPDDPLTFTASIAPLQSAITVASDGGARMKIDIEESTVAAANQMLDLMVKRPRAIFAAAIVVILEPEEAQQDAPKPVKVRGWKEPKT